MAKDSIPKDLPISPLSLACPLCKAKPNQDCIPSDGRFGVMHVARIGLAVGKDMEKRKTREKAARESSI